LAERIRQGFVGWEKEVPPAVAVEIKRSKVWFS
jgi:hypothetical protein